MTIRILFLIALLAGSAWAETMHFTYDEVGRLLSVRYGSGRLIEYTYDKSGNLLQRVVSNSPAPPSAADKPKKSPPDKKTAPPRRDRQPARGNAR